MARVSYFTKPRKFQGAARSIILKAIDICEEYAENGYDLTLRQLYYQFVARGYIENSQRAYKRLGSIVNDARMAGYLDWDFIVDRTRNLSTRAAWDSPADLLRVAAKQYAIDLWEEQDTRVEVWVEKEALAGVVERVSRRLAVPHFSCRGYVSQSEMRSAGQRLLGHVADGKRVVILHLGDHDPSGIDMTRDIEERLFIFTSLDLMRDHPEVVDHAESMNLLDFREHVKVQRIALNWDQVEEYDPPPNPAKVTDSRARDYIAEYGHESWELDALPPDVLGELIEDHVLEHRDEDIFRSAWAAQETQRHTLIELASRFDDVVETLDIDVDPLEDDPDGLEPERGDDDD